ncbi:hypothetical protein [Clostridium tyrobutyricum]|uniref:hypothetical protein n=1 Tax=Clostridium tyrobutyricum TaxID=1519 RepID=UPI0005808087|nr:hypothetical protein [Clostridium tyrobutyricum]
MEEDKIVYFNIYKKYLAYAMSFLGFNFKKNVDYNGKIVYTFQRTKRFDECFNRLLILKNQYGNYQKDYL